MNKWVTAALFASMVGLSAGPASAAADEKAAKQASTPMPMVKSDHLFEERAGTWKATCDEMEVGKVYCRMFHIEQFGEWKAKNFVQLGPAWGPDSAGFVVATYLGFKEGTTVTIGVDKHTRHQVTAPKGNNLMLSPEFAAKILQEMESGHKIVVTFNTHSGVRHLALADLDAYKTLLAKVKARMADNTPAEEVEQ